MSLVQQSASHKGNNRTAEEKVVSVEISTDISAAQSPAESKPVSKEDPLQVLVDADDEQCLIEEATVLNTKEVKTKEIMIEPPAIPKRNTLRTSRLLDSLKLNSIETATKSLNNSHNVYLSSEEDASSSADEYSDDDYESSSEESEKSPIRRKSQEVTARAVSVVFVGKPSVVDLASCRRSVSPAKRPQSEFFGRSVSSPFGSDSPLNRPDFQPRKFSLASASDLPKESPSFLSQDPFSESPYTRRESILTIDTSSSPTILPRAPRTPTKAFQRFQKSISLARKRSRANLKAAAESNASMSSLNLPNLNTSKESQESNKLDSASPVTQSPVTYNEVLRAARRNSVTTSSITSTITQSPTIDSQPASPIVPIPAKRSLLSGLSMNRRRSMRIKT
ncbi:hypothetical protein F5Y03DRAFT_200103 [Xylaria venustula]|nr:hypothetical protein F5Y03DRAFT_200103 [Xylaria venustula]